MPTTLLGETQRALSNRRWPNSPKTAHLISFSYFAGCKFSDIGEFQSLKRNGRSNSSSNNSENHKSCTEKKSVINGETPISSMTVSSRAARLQRRQAQKANQVCFFMTIDLLNVAILYKIFMVEPLKNSNF